MQQGIAGVARQERPRELALGYARVWLLGYALVLAAVVVLAVAAHSFSVLPGDLKIERELQENRNPLVFVSMYAVSWLGYEPQAILIYVLVVVGLWLARLRLEAVFLVLAVAADGISDLVKLLVARSRPSAQLVDVVTHLNSYSFPSGHTVHYTVFYGFLAFVLATRFRIHWLRQVFLAICIALIVLVGFSRVYLGEHWPTDVLGGYLIGGLFLVPFIAVYLWAGTHIVILAHWPFIEWYETVAGPEHA
jgi:undecaprenyl-diphosphatase